MLSKRKTHFASKDVIIGLVIIILLYAMVLLYILSNKF